MALFRKRVNEIRRYLHERLDNDAKSFRFSTENDDIVWKKIKYIEKHIKILTEQEKFAEQTPCYGFLGIAYIKLKDYRRAKDNLLLQLEMAIEHKDEGMERMAYGNLGFVSKQEWKFAEALDYYKHSLDLALRQNNKYAQGRLYNNIGNILELQMNFEAAIEQHQEHLRIATALSDRDGIVKSCGALAALYHSLNDPPNAISYIEQLMDQLRKNLKVLDTLADDASDSDADEYIDIEEPDSDDEEDGSSDEGEDGDGLFGKIKAKFGF